MVVMHRAIRQDLRRLGACLGELASEGVPAARAGAVSSYTAGLLTGIRAHQQGEDEILWPLIAAAAGAAVDLAPLTDDHQAIEVAVGAASRALGRLGAEPGALGGLRTPVAALSGMLDEHIADEEAQVVPAIRRYLTAGACLWCEKQIWRRAPLRDRMFTVPWLARHAQPQELRRLMVPGGCRAWLLLAAARPGYRQLERQAFGSGDPRRVVAGAATGLREQVATFRRARPRKASEGGRK
jgi:Hemerythrin HHE cation binding domain